MSALTLGLCVERLPASVLPQPDPPDLEGFNAQEELRNNINRVLERFIAEGKWVGVVTQAVITSYADLNENRFITLPRHLEVCIRGGRSGSYTQGVQSEWYQYLPQGRGIRRDEMKYCGPIQDMGEGFCTFKDLSANSTLALSSSATECAGTYVWVRGLDQDGNKIYSDIDGERIDGIRIDLSEASTTTTQTFSKITSVEKTVTSGVITLVDSSGVILARYESGERVINYRRYLVDSTLSAVHGIFKRKSVWAISDNDPIYPDTLEAIKLGLIAINAEESGDVERGQYYMDRAITLLNAELKEYNSGQEGVLQIAPWLSRRLFNLT